MMFGSLGACGNWPARAKIEMAEAQVFNEVAS
jgi:hypothetical protein